MMMMNKSRFRSEPIELTEPTSFLPVLDFGSPPKSSKRLPPLPPLPPPPPQRKLKSKKSHHPVSTFLTLERLEDIEEEREEDSLPSVPLRRADTQRKRIARLWDFNRISSIITQQAPSNSDAKSIVFNTQSIFSNTPADDTNNRYSFPLPPNTIPRQSYIDDQLSPLDPDVTFLAPLNPLSPASPATSGSCYSPLFSGALEHFTPITPASLPFNNNLVISVAPDHKRLSLSAPHAPTSTSDLSVQHQRACPSPDLDPELCAHSSGSSLSSDDVDGLTERPEELDEFKIIPRLFGSWSFDASMGILDEYSQSEDTYEDTRWDRAIDEVFAMVRSRRPSAQSEFGCIPDPDANIPSFDKDLVRRLNESSTWLMPGRAAPFPPTPPRSSTYEDSEAVEAMVTQVIVAPLNVKKPEKHRPIPLATVPFNPSPPRFAAAGSPDFDRPPPTQELPSAAFSPMSTFSVLPPTSVSPFVHPVDIDSWPVWSAYESSTDRRPSGSGLSLISKFSDDSIDIKIRHRGGLTSSRRNKLGTSMAWTTSPEKTPVPPSAWFNRGAKTANRVGSSFTRLHAIATQVPKENKGKRSSRLSAETVASQRSSSPARSASPLKSVLRKS